MKNMGYWNELVHGTIGAKLRVVLLFALFASVVIVPLIVQYAIVYTSEPLNVIYGKETALVDVAAYRRAQWLQGISITLFTLSAARLLLERFTTERGRRKAREGTGRSVGAHTTGSMMSSFWLWSVLFAISILLSYALSETKTLAWSGSVERYEGTFTWLCYVMLGLSAYMNVRSERDLRLMMTAVICAATVVSLIGLFQMLRLDLFKTDLGRWIVFGRDYKLFSNSMSIGAREGTPYSTLMNSNYMAPFLGVSIAVTLSMMLRSASLGVKITAGLTLILQIAVLIGSQAASGIVALIGGFAAMLIPLSTACRMSKKKKWTIALSLAVALLVLVFSGALSAQIEKLRSVFTAAWTPNEKLMSDIQVRDRTLRIRVVNGVLLEVTPFVDERGDFDILPAIAEAQNPLSTSEPWIRTVKNSVIGYSLSDRETDRMHYGISYDTETGGVAIRVTNGAETAASLLRLHYYMPSQFSYFAMPIDESHEMDGYVEWVPNELGFSKRGYIWNSTLYVIAKRPWFGYGADALIAVFPHHNLLHKQHPLQGLEVIDKPHSALLQVLVNFGLLGLAAITGILVSALTGEIRLMRRTESRETRFIPLLVPALTAYLLSGISNDSVVSSAVLLAVLIGSSRGVCRGLRTERE